MDTISWEATLQNDFASLLKKFTLKAKNFLPRAMPSKYFFLSLVKSFLTVEMLKEYKAN